MPVEQVVVDLTTTAERADAALEAARAFLLERRIAKPNPAPDRLWQGAELLPGPLWADAVQAGERQDRSWLLAFGTGVELIAGRRRWGVAGAEPACPRCAAPLGPAEAAGEVDGDRIARCASCGRRSRLRKWVPVTDPAEGEAAVRFEGWPSLDDGFADALGEAMGAERVAVVRSSG